MTVIKQELRPLPIPISAKHLDLFTEEGFLRIREKGAKKASFQSWAWVSALDRTLAEKLMKNIFLENAPIEPGRFSPRLVSRMKTNPLAPLFPTFLGFDGIAQCSPWLNLHLGTIGGLCSSEGYQAESIQAYTSHGTLRLGAAKTSILFRSESGMVTIAGPFQTAQGTTDSGSVTIHIFPPCESIQVRSKSGDLTLVIHSNVKALIDFESNQGNVIGKIPYGDQRVEPSVSSRRPLGVRHLLLTIPPDFKPGKGAGDNPGIRIHFQTREGALILQAPVKKKR